MIKFTFLVILLLSCYSCGNREVCDWQYHLLNINNSKGSKSIHPSENWFVPDMTEQTKEEGLKIMLQDFRQFEFISQQFDSLIQNDFHKIKQIKINNLQSSEFGTFENVYIRKCIPNPIVTKFKIHDLERYFSNKISLKPLLITNCGQRQVKGGFSFYNDGIPFYGLLDEDGYLNVLGILEVIPEHDTQENHAKIRRLLVEQNLFLVAWNNESKLTMTDFK